MKHIPYLPKLSDYKGMFKTGCIIFDPAHGQDTPGKCSPDNKHKEWLWSRQHIEPVFNFFDKAKAGLGFDCIYPFQGIKTEPGLRVRVNVYNDIAKNYDFTWVLSPHNDALKNPPAFWKGKGGFTLYSDRGETMADTIINFIGDIMKSELPHETFRFDHGLSKGETVRDKDREANFTVIHGYYIEGSKGRKTLVPAEYIGVLIENLFMDIVDNLIKLQSPEWNKKLQEVYIYMILKVFNEIGLTNMIDQVTVKP